MKKVVLSFLLILFLSKYSFAESVQLWYLYSTEMTDAAATVTHIVDTKDVEDMIVDVVTDKGTTVVITPVLNESGTAVLGEPSDTVTIADGGDSERVFYQNIVAPRAKVVVTKTEAGTTSGFYLSIRGDK